MSSEKPVIRCFGARRRARGFEISKPQFPILASVSDFGTEIDGLRFFMLVTSLLVFALICKSKTN